ncbi:MAG: HAMP domain-containing sensor histidine kinase [Actinomycetota bacterium]
MARSLRGRLARALGLTAALSLAASALITFGLVRRYTADQAVAELRRSANVIAVEARDLDVLEATRFRAIRRLLEVTGSLFGVVGGNGNVRTDTPEAESVVGKVDTDGLVEGRSSQGFVEVSGTRYAYVAVPVRARFADRPGLVAGIILAKRAGVGWAPIVSRALLAAGLAALLAALASTLLARRLARPVQQVAAATTRVAAGDLTQRVPVEGDDELAELGRSFNAMASALAEARRREGEFLASVSHELRTPLTAIRGYVEALEEGAVRDAKGRREALAVIKTETARLERLVRDVMDLARLDAQEFRLELRDADLADVLKSALGAHGTEAESAGVSLTLVAPSDGLPCRTDPDRVRQILSNLIENAIRVTSAGGRVSLTGSAAEYLIVIEVTDTGPGIPAEHVPHVFERTYLRNVATRAEEGSSEPEPGRLAAGSGLGLAIVRELVRALGGRVEVTSSPGEGTAFRVTLPRSRD